MNVNGIGNSGISEIISNKYTNTKQDDFEKLFQDAIEKNDDKALRQACNEMEKIFLGMIYKQMKATIPESTLMPEDSGKDIMESLLDDSFVEEVSKRSSFGLAEMLYNQLK